MHQTMEIHMARKRRASQQRFLNTYRIFNENISGARLGLEIFNHGFQHKEHEKPPRHPRSPTRHNIPHPYYAKFIPSNVRFLNEPICHMETANTMDNQVHWWPSELPSINLHTPSYDRKTTQRSDFSRLPCSLSSHSRHNFNPNKLLLSGIVPLATPRTASHFPKLLQEQISFHHNYDSRAHTNEPARGKRHGAFVWTEIKPASGTVVPRGPKVFLSAIGSCSHKEPATEKGSLVENSMTSPNLCLQNSQQMFDSEARLSKTDLREAAKAYPRIPVTGQHSSRISQATEVDIILPMEEEELCRPITNALDKPQGRVLTSNNKFPKLPQATATYMEPSVTTKRIMLSPPDISSNTKHQLAPLYC